MFVLYYVLVDMCMCLCLGVCMIACICVYVYMCVRVCMCAVSMCVCVCVRVCVCVNANSFIHFSLKWCVAFSEYVYVCVCVRVCVRARTNTYYFKDFSSYWLQLTSSDSDLLCIKSMCYLDLHVIARCTMFHLFPVSPFCFQR